MNNAANLLNLLALLTVIADASDWADAQDTAEFFWLASPGTRTYLPDGRVLTRF